MESKEKRLQTDSELKDWRARLAPPEMDGWMDAAQIYYDRLQLALDHIERLKAIRPPVLS